MDQITANMLFVKNSIFFDNMGADGNWPAPERRQPETSTRRRSSLNAAWNNREIDPMLGDPSEPDGAELQAGGRLARPHRRRRRRPTTASSRRRDFVGAVGTDDWTAGWTAYPQN